MRWSLQSISHLSEKETGRANEVNYWVFDYPPEKELEVRERVEYLKNKNDRGDDDFELVVFDLYDIIIDFLEKKNFMEKCYDFEKKRGIERIVKAVTNSMKVNDDDSLIVQYIKEHTPEKCSGVPDRYRQVLSDFALPQGA